MEIVALVLWLLLCIAEYVVTGFAPGFLAPVALFPFGARHFANDVPDAAGGYRQQRLRTFNVAHLVSVDIPPDSSYDIAIQSHRQRVLIVLSGVRKRYSTKGYRFISGIARFDFRQEANGVRVRVRYAPLPVIPFVGVVAFWLAVAVAPPLFTASPADAVGPAIALVVAVPIFFLIPVRALRRVVQSVLEKIEPHLLDRE